MRGELGSTGVQISTELPCGCSGGFSGDIVFELMSRRERGCGRRTVNRADRVSVLEVWQECYRGIIRS